MHELEFVSVTPDELSKSQHLAEEDHDVVEHGFVAKINENPLAISIKSVFEKHGQKINSDFYDRFKAWLIPHRFSIVRRSGLAQIISLGCEIEYFSEGTCSIVSLFPEAQFVVRSGIDFSLNGQSRAKISLNGNALPIDTNNSDCEKPAENMSLDLNISGRSYLNFSSRLITPLVSATGIGSRRCEFQFKQYDTPLFGHDIETWSILALPKRQKTLQYKIRFYFISRTAFVPRRSESSWKTISCELLNT